MVLLVRNSSPLVVGTMIMVSTEAMQDSMVSLVEFATAKYFAGILCSFQTHRLSHRSEPYRTTMEFILKY